jgi:phage terminase large subunit
MLDEINRIKENDYEYYLYLYEGVPVGFQDNVYNIKTFNIINELPSDDSIVALFYSLDGGHAQSATTVLLLGLTAKGKVILLDTYYYSPAGKSVKLAPSQLSQEVHKFATRTQSDSRWKGKKVYNRTIDSAEAALRNQYYLDYEIRWNPVAKKEKLVMIDYATNLFAQGRFYILDTNANQIFIEEHKRYSFKEGTGNTDNPIVLKEDDHTCDAFQYFCIDNAQVLGIAV